MTFHAFLSLIAFSVSVTRPTPSHFVIPSNLLFSPAALSVDHSSCHKMFLFLSSHHRAKNVPSRLPILFMRDLVVSASRSSVSFGFFAFHEIRSILHGTHFFLPPISFEIVQASHPYIRMGSM